MFKKKIKKDCENPKPPIHKKDEKVEDPEKLLKYDYFRKFVLTSMQGVGEISLGFPIGGWKSFKISETDDIIMTSWVNKTNDDQCKVVIAVHDLGSLKELQRIEIKQCFDNYGDLLLEYIPSSKEILFTQSGEPITNIWVYEWNVNDKKFEKSNVVDLRYSWILEAIAIPQKNLLLFGTRGNGILILGLKEKNFIKRLEKIQETNSMLLINEDYLLVGGELGEMHLVSVDKCSSKSMMIMESDITSSDFFVNGFGKVEEIVDKYDDYRIFLGDYDGNLQVCTFDPKAKYFLTKIYELKVHDEILRCYFINEREILFTSLDNKLYLLDYTTGALSRNMIPEVMYKIDYFHIDTVRGRILFREYRNRRILIIK